MTSGKIEHIAPNNVKVKQDFFFFLIFFHAIAFILAGGKDECSVHEMYNEKRFYGKIFGIFMANFT